MSQFYLIDSNVYIRAFREAAFGAELQEFHRRNLPRLVLSAVVATELLVGAQRPERWRALERALIEPFRTRRRLIAAAAREIGATIITENDGDFMLLARHIDIAFVPPFPFSPAA